MFVIHTNEIYSSSTAELQFAIDIRRSLELIYCSNTVKNACIGGNTELKIIH